MNNSNKKVQDVNDSVELLKLEFDYAKSTSLQSQSDRLAIVNFFIAIFGAIASISLGLANSNTTYSNFFSLGFFVISIIGFVFIIKIIRLRQAWVESAKAMNKIKDYFIQKNPDVGEFIIWKTNTIPKAEKFKTISYLSSFLINILSSISLFLGCYLSDFSILWSFVLSGLFFFTNLLTYYIFLKYNK